MSIGNWLYYKRKFKLIVLPERFGFKSKQKNLLGLTYERNWELPSDWKASYFDINSPLTIIPSPDLIVEREFNDGKALYDDLYKRRFKKKSPKAFWFIDAHLADQKRISYCDNFDFVFVAHSPYIELVKKNTVCKNIFWLPLCYPGSTDTIEKNAASLKYPVSFIGRTGPGFEKRNAMVDFLKKEYRNNFFITTNYVNSKTLIQQSKITTNYAIKNDLNFRVFECLGHGTELATNYVDDIDKIEGLRERLYHFNDHNELKKKIDAVLADNIKVKHNMDSIQHWIKQNHTMKNRLAEMLEMIDTGKQIAYK